MAEEYSDAPVLPFLRTTSSKYWYVPEVGWRPYRTIARSGPPTWFQLVYVPLYMFASWSRVRVVTVFALLVIMAMPSMATLNSTASTPWAEAF